MLPTGCRQITDRLLKDHQQSIDSWQTDHSTESTGCRPTAGNLLVCTAPQMIPRPQLIPDHKRSPNWPQMIPETEMIPTADHK